MKSIQKTAFFLFFLFLQSASIAQNIQFFLGPDEIGENQAWTITVTVNNDRLKSYENFPDIEGFRKRGTSSSSQTNIVNGQVSSSQSIIMTYTPTQRGIFTLPAFKMKVNDQVFNVAGKKIKVGQAVQAQSNDPFANFFGRDPSRDFFGKGETEFVDVKEDALLALSTSKEEVYVGEGFTATLSFLVADNNRAPMQFYELGKQLTEILKKLKPSTCWEENFNIENIEGEPFDINGKGYTRYKLYQATYYPLNNQAVTFPSVGLDMIKFKVAKNPSFFGQNRKEDFKKFFSKVKIVRVKELPPHPNREGVGVGNYRLEERISTNELQTGQSVTYDFNVIGEGNISSIEKPIVKKDNVFELYEPNVKQNITRDGGRVMGNKSFSYFMIPKEPGVYKLGDYFQWIYFNTNSRRYDTLRSSQVVKIVGESQRNQAIESNDLGSFYDKISIADNTLQSTATNHWLKTTVNIFILLILGLAVYFIFKKK